MSERATRRQVMAVAAQFGIRVHDDGEKVSIDAPRYYVLKGSGLHFTDVRYGAAHGAWPKPEVWGEVLHDIRDGIEPCEDPECDCCHDDEGWAQWEERVRQEDAEDDHA